MTEQLDIFTSPAWAAAIGGMTRAADHAEAEAPGWSDRARSMLLRFIEQHPGEAFSTPDVRRWAERQGLDAPAHMRAWGQVIRAAKVAGVIRQHGFRTSTDPTMRCQSVRVWMAA